MSSSTKPSVRADLARAHRAVRIVAEILEGVLDSGPNSREVRLCRIACRLINRALDTDIAEGVVLERRRRRR